MKKFIPSLLTLLGMFCGVWSFYFFIFRGDVETGLVFLSLAVMLDFADGFVARKLNAVSVFGGQLDSLSDFFNFGVMPGVFVYQASLQVFGMYGWAAVGAYVFCAAARLARFNARSILGHQTGSSMYFSGLPVPFGGFVLCLIPWLEIPRLSVAAFVLVISSLMLSTIKFYSLFKFVFTLGMKWIVVCMLGIAVFSGAVFFTLGLSYGFLSVILLQVVFAAIYPLLTIFKS